MKIYIFLLLNVVCTLYSCAAAVDADSTPVLKNDRYSIVFHKCGNGYGVSLVGNDGLAARQDYPAQVTVAHAHGIDEDDYSGVYTSVNSTGRAVEAIGELSTPAGSKFIVTDTYTPRDNCAFLMHRTVTVEKAGTQDIGFASSVSFRPDGTYGDSRRSYDYMLPSILYKDTCDLRPGTVAADMSAPRLYVKETRMGLPLAMIRSRKSGSTFALMHYRPQISVGTFASGGTDGEVNDSLRYGALGYNMTPTVSVDFRYPCAEGPATYEPDIKRKPDGTVWTTRYHTMRPGNSHDYTLLLMPGRWDGYNDAMTTIFRQAYEARMPDVADVDMDSIYIHNIRLFTEHYREFGTGDVKAAGVPWALFLPDGRCDGYSFQMGFVGQQLPVGYHLYRYGLDHGNTAARRMGEAILDFWSSSTFTDTYFPTVWWDPADNATAGNRRDYPTFLRCMVDGMEGLLDACRIAEAYGEAHPQWDAALQHVASNLVNRQNADGSFCRAYRTDGEVETGGDRNTFGTSRLNTPLPVRFLVKMYERTGDDKYRTAALRAVEFAYDELYSKLGKYVGGTPDNPNTVDKEAALYAMYAFNAAHGLTGDEKYLQAAEHAAMCAMSWVYCYDFAIPNRNKADAAINPFAEGGVQGFSIISTGHSGADNYMAYAFYEMFKLYIKTGNPTYRHMAWLLQNDTKRCTDFDGRMNYRYRALMPEATNVADMAFRSVSVWLPWASIANIEPIVQLEETFGRTDVMSPDMSLDSLRERLEQYGSGGYPLIRMH